MIQKGDDSDSLFIVRTGWLKVITNDSDGDEITLNQTGPGEILGELSLVDRGARSNTVVAISDVQVLEIQYDIIHAVITAHPAFALSLIDQMAHRLRFANAYINVSTEWCQRIALGDYDFVEERVKEEQTSMIMSVTQAYAAKAATFLSSFFKMTKEVHSREDNLKAQVHTLTIQIDEAKRQQAVAEVTETDFFQQIRKTVKRLRKPRPSKSN